MGTALIVIGCIAVAHFCRLRRDNLAALGFLGLGLFVIWPGWLFAAWNLLLAAWDQNQGLLGTLLGWAVLLGCCVWGLKLIFSAKS